MEEYSSRPYEHLGDILAVTKMTPSCAFNLFFVGFNSVTVMRGWSSPGSHGVQWALSLARPTTLDRHGADGVYGRTGPSNAACWVLWWHFRKAVGWCLQGSSKLVVGQCRTYFAKSVPLATKDHHGSGFGWQELCSFKPLELQVTACSRVGWKLEGWNHLEIIALETGKMWNTGLTPVSFFQPRTPRANFSKATLGSTASLCRAATDSTPRSLPSMGRRGLGLSVSSGWGWQYQSWKEMKSPAKSKSIQFHEIAVRFSPRRLKSWGKIKDT